MPLQIRLARPVSDLGRAARMYCDALGLIELGRFTDHAGFDGIMLGKADENWHLEFTYCHAHPVLPTPTPEDLLVFYVPQEDAWRQTCSAVLRAGFIETQAFNPYWQVRGRSFQDPDGYRLVIQMAAWRHRQDAADAA